MKRAIRTLGWRFSADRMVMDYVRHVYIPAAGGTSSDMSQALIDPVRAALRRRSRTVRVNLRRQLGSCQR